MKTHTRIIALAHLDRVDSTRSPDTNLLPTITRLMIFHTHTHTHTARYLRLLLLLLRLLKLSRRSFPSKRSKTFGITFSITYLLALQMLISSFFCFFTTTTTSALAPYFFLLFHFFHIVAHLIIVWYPSGIPRILSISNMHQQQ